MTINKKQLMKISMLLLISIFISAFFTALVCAEETDAGTSEDSKMESSETSSVGEEEKNAEPSKDFRSATARQDDEEPEGENGLTDIVPQNYTFTGAATLNIPILAAPGRAGVAPNLSLQYNSYQKNGLLGVGWNLDIGSIQRSTKYGVDYSGNDYVAVMNGSSTKLVAAIDLGAGYYRARIEGTTFFRYYLNPTSGGWEVITKSGTKYYYGTTPDSRQDNSLGVFRWCLDRVEDTNGNYMNVTYLKDQGEIYPDRIDYTGNGSLLPSNYVKFHYETRPDTSSMFTTNSKVITANRLKTIAVYAVGALVRAYKFTYSMSLSTYRSLLESVQQYGTDAIIDVTGTVTGGSALPEITLGWQGASKFKFDIQNWGSIPSVGTILGDFNGDAKTDIATITDNSTLSLKISTGSSFESQDWGCLTNNSSQGGNIPGDFNGDGKTDIISYNSDASETLTVNLSTGNSFDTNMWEGELSIDNPRLNFLGDFNGDGKIDIASYIETQSELKMNLSTGNGFNTQIWESQFNNGDQHLLGDFNGDGVIDLANYTVKNYSSIIENSVLLMNISNGVGFEFQSWNVSPDSSFMFQVCDFNGDGKSDLICPSQNHSSLLVHISTGNRFEISSYPLNIESFIYFGGSDDLNRDGNADIVAAAYSTGLWMSPIYIYLSDILISTSNSFINSFSLRYLRVPSSLASNIFLWTSGYAIYIMLMA